MRAVVWAAHVALPAMGIWLLVAEPRLDAVWRDPLAHFWLVGPVTAISAGLALLTGRSARRHADARLFLVSLAMLASAVFLGLHALATPGVLVPPNAGFVLATSFGLAVAAAFAMTSAGEFTADRSGAVLGYSRVLRAGVGILAVGWAVASAIPATPLGRPLGAGAYVTGLAAIGAGGFGIAAVRYALAYRARPGVVLLSVLTAFVLLAEAAVAIAAGPGWHLSWWGWHLLVLTGFCFVAYSAYAEYQREGSAAGIFDGVAAGPALAALRAEYADALESLVAALAATDPGSMGRVTARLAARFG